MRANRMEQEVNLSIRYLQQVLQSDSPQFIIDSADALLTSLGKHTDTSSLALQEKIIAVLKLLDKKCLLKESVKSDEVKKALDALAQVAIGCKRKATTANDDEKALILSPQKTSVQKTAEDQTVDHLLTQLNIRPVATFSPTFPKFENESDDDNGVTTSEKKEERAEKHGQKMCEEEVQKLADGREVRTKKTKTVNVQSTTRHVTISTKGGNLPSVSRKFIDGDRNFDEDNEEETTDFFSRSRLSKHGDPFANFRKKLEFADADADETEPQVIPGESKKTKTVERTSDVTQSVSEKKERAGKVLGEHLASKHDSSKLQATLTDTFLEDKLLDRKGEGSYEESSITKYGLPGQSIDILTVKPKITEFVETIGQLPTEDDDKYLRATAISSYITLNDNLRYHEEQYRKKVQFEFSIAGTSSCTIDVSNLAEILSASENSSFNLPKLWAIESAPQMEGKQIDWQTAISNVPDDLVCSLKADDYIAFRMREDGKYEARGAPIDALIVYATQASESSPLFQEAFILTYRSFITSNDLINKLIKRYLFLQLSHDRLSQSAVRNTFSILVRIVDGTTRFEYEERLLKTLTSFVYRLINDGSFMYAKVLRERFIRKIDDYFDFSTFYDSKLISNKKMSLFDFKSSVIASQLTLLDMTLFQRIESAELLWWSESQNEIRCPNLVRFTEHFNSVSFWVRTQVLSQPTQKERERYYLKFVKVMKGLKKLSNFNSFLAILSALMSSPLARLDWSKQVQESLKEHSPIMDATQSYKNYRALLIAAVPPCVPYIGVVLQDLTFTHVGNPHKLPADKCEGKTNMINFLKRWHQFAILDLVRNLKKWNYDVARDEKTISFFDGFKNKLDEEKTWELSHHIKPSNRRKP